MELKSTLKMILVSYSIIFVSYLLSCCFTFWMKHKPVESIKYKICIYIYLEKTSLMNPAEKGYTDIVNILLEHGADVNTKDKDG